MCLMECRAKGEMMNDLLSSSSSGGLGNSKREAAVVFEGLESDLCFSSSSSSSSVRGNYETGVSFCLCVAVCLLCCCAVRGFSGLSHCVCVCFPVCLLSSICHPFDRHGEFGGDQWRNREEESIGGFSYGSLCVSHRLSS